MSSLNASPKSTVIINVVSVQQRTALSLWILLVQLLPKAIQAPFLQRHAMPVQKMRSFFYSIDALRGLWFK